jgi:hypothetical protein
MCSWANLHWKQLARFVVKVRQSIPHSHSERWETHSVSNWSLLRRWFLRRVISSHDYKRASLYQLPANHPVRKGHLRGLPAGRKSMCREHLGLVHPEVQISHLLELVITAPAHSSFAKLTELWAGRPGFDSRQGQERDFFSVRHRIQNGSGARTSSYSVGSGGFFPWGKAAVAWKWPLFSI